MNICILSLYKHSRPVFLGLALTLSAQASPILLDPNFTGTPAGQYFQAGSLNGPAPLLGQPTQGVLPGASAGVVKRN